MNRAIMALVLAAVFIVPAVLAEDSEAASSPGTAVYYSDVGLITITFNERLPGPAEYGARFYQGHYEVPTPSAAYWSQDLVSLGNTHTVNLSDSQYSPEKPLRNLPQGGATRKSNRCSASARRSSRRKARVRSTHGGCPPDAPSTGCPRNRNGANLSDAGVRRLLPQVSGRGPL